MSLTLFDLKGKNAIVTGSSRGLGKYMAIALAKAGARIILTSRNKENCDTSIKAIHDTGSQAEAFSLDVRSEQSINEFSNNIRMRYETIDILVNNAGCNIRKPVTEVTWDDWDTVVNTNLRGTFFVTKTIVPMMMEHSYGRIINIGSVTAVFGYEGVVPYCASRGGVLQMTKAMADEFGSRGITVNCLAPGWFKTEQTKVLYENPEWLAYIIDRIPLCRPGQPRDLDGAVVFLASDASEYITGQILLVEGGITTGATRATVK
jgi:NAD(P)-dependent dehydrogenase (short-subunit alcohol dehydrogenase family)